MTIRADRFSFNTLCELSGPELDNLITQYRADLFQLKRKRWEKVAQVLYLQMEIDKELKFLNVDKKMESPDKVMQ